MKTDLIKLELNSFITASKLKSKDDTFIGYPMTLDEGYTVEGFLLKEIKIGDNLLLMRTNRNGVRQLGMFTTSKILDIQGDVVQTANSYWKIEHLNEN
jgi:hypothetical protein